jgi:hypothetical protein
VRRWLGQDAPGDGEAIGRLLELLLDADRFERAREVIAGPPGKSLDPEARAAWEARIRAAAKAAGQAEEEADQAPGLPTDADVVRFHHLFSGRENVYARQWAAEGGEGGYTPVREPLTAAAATYFGAFGSASECSSASRRGRAGRRATP